MVHNTWSKVRRYEELSKDDDGDGVVALRPAGDEKTIPPYSIWAAVDVATGAAAATMYGQPALRPLPLSSLTIDVPTQGNAPAKLELPCRAIDILWVRPGVGSWSRRIYDGDDADDDLAPDGRIRVPLVSLHPTPDGPAGQLRKPAKNDVVFLVDPRRMEAALLVVKEER